MKVYSLFGILMADYNASVLEKISDADRITRVHNRFNEMDLLLAAEEISSIEKLIDEKKLSVLITDLICIYDKFCL